MSGNSIFVKICSLDDTELITTIDDAIMKSSGENRLHFGIYLIYKDTKTLRTFVGNLKRWKMFNDAEFTVRTVKYHKELLGVGQARNVVDNLYDGQKYVLQIDSHSWFPWQWDTTLIDLIKYHSSKTILTGYAGPYQYSGLVDRRPIGLGKLQLKVPTKDRLFCEWMDNWYTIYPKEETPYIKTDFCANFAFGTHKWGEYSGVDPQSIFYSEEPIQTKNLKNKGFRLLYPNIDEPLICHLYTQDIRKKGTRKNFTDYISYEEADYLMNFVDRNVYCENFT